MNLEALLEIDPYAGGTALIALTVRELAPQYRDHLTDLMHHGATIWGAAQRALRWWTPARTEQEALRRAGDTPSPSVISREVALFTAIYEQYAEVAYALVQRPERSAERDAVRFQLDLIRATIEGLERRAQAAEMRATDYRLRYEFEQLRQVVAGREFASKIAELLEQASKNSASIDHLRAVFEDVRPALDRLERQLEATRLDAEYTADRVMEEAVRRALPMARVKESLAALSDSVGVGGFLTQVFVAMSRHL